MSRRPRRPEVITTNPLEWSLVQGWLPPVLTLFGLIAFAAVTASRRRAWWDRTLPVTLTTCTVLVAGLVFAVDVLWRPFPEPLPPPVMVWLGFGLLTLVLAVLRLRTLRPPGRVGVLLATLVVGVAAVAQVNVYFGAYPTPRAALGLTITTVPFEQVPVSTSMTTATPEGTPLREVWQPPAGMPERGVVSEVVIPSSRGFVARPARVYLPPAYLSTPRARLPVLVMLAGQPGSPTDWLDFGQLPVAMDRFAAAHGGLAPVVVMPDHLGSTLANPLCVDSPLGDVETYLALDVPAWIRENLQVETDPGAWAIGGFSQGGTCALQLAVRKPAVYPNFVDIAGQREPTLGDRRLTVDSVFGGNAAAYAEINPLDVLAGTRFPGSAGIIVAGREDTRYREDARDVFEACRRAGMDVRRIEVPGGHNWTAWRLALDTAMPWLARQLGLAR